MLAEGEYREQAPANDGWLRSAATGIQFRGEADRKLAMQIIDDQSTRQLLPDD